jgi:hypothetical protein
VVRKKFISNQVARKNGDFCQTGFEPRTFDHRVGSMPLREEQSDGVGKSLNAVLPLLVRNAERCVNIVTIGIVGPGYQPGCIVLRVGNLAD